MNQNDLMALLKSVRSGSLAPEAAVERLRQLPFEDLGFAKVDHHRALRQGFAEVVFGKGKTAKQAAEIVQAMVEKKSSRHNVLVTRADRGMFAAVKRVAREAEFHPLSGVITIERSKEITGKGTIVVVSAGTSDIPVAEEAVLTARIMGNRSRGSFAAPGYRLGAGQFGRRDAWLASSCLDRLADGAGCDVPRGRLVRPHPLDGRRCRRNRADRRRASGARVARVGDQRAAALAAGSAGPNDDVG